MSFSFRIFTLALIRFFLHNQPTTICPREQGAGLLPVADDAAHCLDSDAVLLGIKDPEPLDLLLVARNTLTDSVRGALAQIIEIPANFLLVLGGIQEIPNAQALGHRHGAAFERLLPPLLFPQGGEKAFGRLGVDLAPRGWEGPATVLFFELLARLEPSG